MDRRKFIKNSSLVLGASAISSLFISCSKNNDSSPWNPPEEYIPDVDEIPYKYLEYFRDSGTSYEGGQLNFINPPILSPTFLDMDNGNSLSGISGIRNYDKKFSESGIFVYDTNLQYLPTFVFKDETGNRDWPFVHLRSLINALTQGGDVFVNKIDEYLPSWDWEHIDDKPGMVYMGDWTIGEINNFVELGSEVASIVVNVFAPGTSSTAYSILSNIGDTQDLVNKGINTINNFFPGAIDTEKKYALFTADPSGLRNFFIYGKELSDELKNRTVDVKDLIPLNPGSWWKYSVNSLISRAKIDGYEKVKERNLIKLVDETGFEEYLGFKNNFLRYYGFKDSSVGRIFFKTPPYFGDNAVQKGKNYFVENSKIICEDYPEISGEINESYNYIDRENLIVNGKAYGACFKVLESFDISLKNDNTGETISDSNSATHWYCKNIGKVKSLYNGIPVELINFNIESSEINKKSYENLETLTRSLPTREKIISDTIKLII